MGYILQNYKIYLQKPWDIFRNSIGYIGQNYGIYLAKTKRYIM